jgi:DNA gyrase inhibitor GyrI
MEQLDVRNVKLEPMRLVSVLGFGSSPEEIAWAKLQAFAEPRGLWGNLEKQRIFGFNNPNPSPGSPNYGYELWIEVGPGVEPPADGRIVNFDGGLYAVARCEVPQGGAYEVIPATWQKLVTWLESSAYQRGSHQWLEQSVPFETPGIEFALDLMMPITT